MPTEPSLYPCIDAMVFISYNNAGLLELLEAIWPGGVYSPEVVMAEEIGTSVSKFPQNQAIVDLPWVTSVPVDDPSDVAFSVGLLALWQSPPRRDRGEADMTALCRRHGWLAITDDKNGRGALEHHGCHLSYMCSVLVAAAATGHAGLDVSSAYAAHQAVESGRNAPRLNSRAKFSRAVALTKRLAQSLDNPAWPHLLRDSRIDVIIDRIDKRPDSRKFTI